MPNTIKVELSQSFEGHKGVFNELEFREPRWAEIAEFGEPFKWQDVEGGQRFWVESLPTLRSYAEACLVGPETHVGVTLDRLGVADTRKVLMAVGRFFLPENAEDAGSTTLPST